MLHQCKLQIRVEKISACTELANSPNIITGNGIKIGTSRAKTETTSSSASTLPKRRKLNERGLVKSSRILIGKKNRSRTYIS